MCTVCGCGTASIADQSEHTHKHGHAHPHDHDHGEVQDHVHEDRNLDFGRGLAGVSFPGMSQARTIRVERDILSRNAVFAQANRNLLHKAQAFAINLLSSPGSGKTTLLVRTIAALKHRWPIAVIEGDQQTSLDADRIRETGVPALQINTGKGCHLDAHMVGHALEHMTLPTGALVFIENVGNLVCPAAFDLGENVKIVVLSVTEGEDKPLKYPDMFAAADLLLLNKSDLLPYLDFDVDACIAAALRVNPDLHILIVSARTGAGFGALVAWIEARAGLAGTMR